MYKILPILLFAYGLCLTTDDIYDNSWALIIGINKYENVQKLNYAVDDAEFIQEMLVKYFDFSIGNIIILKDERATKQNILKEFSAITKSANENDRVIIFFAGHGETMELPGGGEMGYLIPVDGSTNDLYLSSIGMAELKNLAIMSKAKHVLYLVDACYGGLAAVGTRGLIPTETNNYIDKISKNKARQIITAGGKGEKVLEKSELGHSVFTDNLKRGLQEGNADVNSDGYITGNELAMYLEEKVTNDSENMQTPIYGRMTSDEGEIIFVSSSYKINDSRKLIVENDISEEFLLEQFKNELKETRELNQLLIKQFKNLDSESHDALFDNNVHSINKNPTSSKSRYDSFSNIQKFFTIYPGIGYVFEDKFKKGIMWSGLFTSSIVSNFVSYNIYNNSKISFQQDMSNYNNAVENFDFIREKTTNSQSDMVQSKRIFYLTCISSGVLWYMAYNDYNNYKNYIDVDLSYSQLKITLYF
jgi:hypothetical protein